MIRVVPGQSITAALKEAARQARGATVPVAVLLAPGVYREHVEYPRDCAWVDLGAEVKGQAHIIAPTQLKPAIVGGGLRDCAIRDLWVTGGLNGIQVSQNGVDLDDMIRRVLIADNRVEGVAMDAIKVNGGEDVSCIDNIVGAGPKGQAIDYCAIQRGRIGGNRMQAPGGWAFFAKMGSSDLIVTGNKVRKCAYGLVAGGQSGEYPFHPGAGGFEAARILIAGNDVEATDVPVGFMGADDSEERDNILRSLSPYARKPLVMIASSKPVNGRAGIDSRNIRTQQLADRIDRRPALAA